MYDLQPLRDDADERRRLAALLGLCFPSDARFSPAYLDWMYRQNPHGHALGWNALRGGELVAHYVTLPVLARLDGAERRGLLSLNTATHPAHQGQKLFTRLAERTYDEAAARGFEFVVGVANANSTPGFTRKLGFHLVGPLDVRLGFGDLPDSDERDGTSVAFSRVWSGEALAWRVARPDVRYAVVRRGAACRIHAPTGKPGIRALLYRGAAHGLAEQRAPAARSPVTLYLGVDPELRLPRLRWMELPFRLRPSPLNLILKSLGRLRCDLPRDRVRLSAIDFDAY